MPDDSAAVDAVPPLPRSWPGTDADDELRLLTEFLTFLRVTAVNKVSGLSRDLAAATPLPTSPVVSVLGVVKHLTAVERFWISIVAGGLDVPSLWEDDPDHDWRLSPDDTPASVVAAYQQEWARSDDALRGLAPGDRTRRTVGDKPRTVRWVLAHVVQETARHVGHLDLLREMADGTRGE